MCGGCYLDLLGVDYLTVVFINSMITEQLSRYHDLVAGYLDVQPRRGDGYGCWIGSWASVVVGGLCVILGLVFG